ncbi:MAG: DinB family protein [Pyrinomonadaceae bacterium]
MNKIADDARSSFGGLSGEQLNWNPAENSWSVGQCLDHLIKTNKEFEPEFKKIADGNRENSFWENWSPFTGFFGRFLIKAVSNDAKKAKAPSKKIVPPSDVVADIVERFVANIGVVNEGIKTCADVDREKTIITSPFLAVMTYKLDDGYTVLVEHSKRHIRQAKRVIEAEGFPA